MIECVTLSTSHLFDGNPLSSMHRLRYDCIIKRQGWQVPHFNDMEFDQYDNPAATYLVWRDCNKIVRGASRLYPTVRPYMLKDVFSFLIERELPSEASILEGTRFCVDESLLVVSRRQIAHEIVVSYLEYGVDNGVKAFVGVMYPAYWRNLFINAGWTVEYLGSQRTLKTGERVRAGIVYVSCEVLDKVRKVTNIHDRVINYGCECLMQG